MDIRAIVRSPGANTGSLRICRPADIRLPGGLIFLSLWFVLISERQIKRGAHRSTIGLERAIRQYLNIYNEDPKPSIWTKSADEDCISE